MNHNAIAQRIESRTSKIINLRRKGSDLKLTKWKKLQIFMEAGNGLSLVGTKNEKKKSEKKIRERWMRFNREFGEKNCRNLKERYTSELD